MSSRTEQEISNAAFLAISGLLVVAWLLVGMVGHHPWKPDEAYSFGLVLQMLQDGDWVVPKLAGEPFLEKPPLYYLSAAAMARLFGGWLPLHDAARLASSFYLVVALTALWAAGRLLWGGRGGLYAALLLVGMVGGLVRLHQMITDVALLAGVAVALCGLVLSRSRPAAGGVVLGLGTGVAFLAKGLLGPGLMGLLVILLPLVSGRWRNRDYLKALAWGALSAAPWLLLWPLLLYLRSPELFHVWFWDNNIGRFLGLNHLGPQNSHLFYLRILVWYALPAWPLVLWLLWQQRGRPAGRPLLIVPLLALPAWLIVLSLSAQSRELYALPLLPPFALLAAGAVDTLPPGLARGWRLAGGLLFSLFSAGVVWLWLVSVTGRHDLLPQRLAHYASAMEQPLRILPTLLAAALLAGWVWLLMRKDSTGRSALLTWDAGLLLTWVLTVLLLLPVLDRIKGYQGVMAELGRHLPKQSGCVASRGLGEPQRAMLQYYLGLKTLRLEVNPEGRKCGWLIAQACRDVPVGSLERKRCRLLWSGSRPADRDERLELYRCDGEP